MSPVTGTTAVIVDFICIIAALLFLVLRLYVRLRILNLSILNVQDGLVIFAWLCFLANVIQDVISNAYGLWSPEIILTADGPPAVEKFIHDPHKLELVLQVRLFKPLQSTMDFKLYSLALHLLIYWNY